MILEDFKNIPDSGLSRFPLGVSKCIQGQVNPQRLQQNLQSQKNHNILRKNTIFNEHPVPPSISPLHHYLSFIRTLFLEKDLWTPFPLTCKNCENSEKLKGPPRDP